MRPVALGAAALVAALVLVPIDASAEDDADCGGGFALSSETGSEITCRRSVTVADPSLAEQIAQDWLGMVDCVGAPVSEPRSTVGDTGDGGWLVTTWFTCHLK